MRKKEGNLRIFTHFPLIPPPVFLIYFFSLLIGAFSVFTRFPSVLPIFPRFPPLFPFPLVSRLRCWVGECGGGELSGGSDIKCVFFPCPLHDTTVPLTTADEKRRAGVAFGKQRP